MDYNQQQAQHVPPPHTPPRNRILGPPFERTPISPVTSRSTPNNGPVYGVPSLQSLRHPYRVHDAYDLSQQVVSPVMSRSASVASDRFSTISALTSTYFPPNPQHVNPRPAYVAPFGAAQVVGEHRARVPEYLSDDGDSNPTKDDVDFSDPALALINAFLDQMLFSFLATARSTTLTALKPAVTEVLKSRLARDAIASAEEELHELLAGGDEEEEVNTSKNSSETNRRWDLELVWKRTRLRVMVYMRLGEMEDDDEERYVKEEELFQGNERRFSQTSGLVSWAAAIFLTGVLEYIAEQSLEIAGNAAFARARRQDRSARSPTAFGDRTAVIVEDHDVEKIALSSTLGRLWRNWRKLLRSNAASVGFAQPRTSSRLNGDILERPSSAGTDSVDERALRLEDVPEMEYPEHVLASNIPLPIGDRRRDVDEIEVPGLAHDPDAQNVEEEEPSAVRRNSFTGAPAYRSVNGVLTPDSAGATDRDDRPSLSRKRSVSVPTPARTPLVHETDQMPGAFPETPGPVPELESPTLAGRDEQTLAPAVQQTTDAPVESAPPTQPRALDPDDDHVFEQKANAAEMASLKRSLISDQQRDKRPRHSLLGTALTGSAAVAAAATVAASVAHEQPKQQRSEQVDRADSNELLTTGPTRDVEELDRRKSLMDLKALLADQTSNGAVSNSAQTIASRDGEESGQKSLPTRRDSEGSNASYTLGDGAPQAAPSQPPAEPMNTRLGYMLKYGYADESGIGMSQTWDTGPFSGSSRGAEESQARDLSKKPTRLILGDSPSHNGIESSTVQSTVPAEGPQGFLESRSLNSKTDRPDFSKPFPQASSDLQRAETAKAAHKRRSIPGVAFTSAAAQPIVEANPHRQSWVAAVQQHRELENGTPANDPLRDVPPMPTEASFADSAAVAQEHPAVAIMNNLRNMNGEKQQEPQEEPERALTSASIRGPEDFDLYVQVAETMKYTLTPEAVRDNPAPSGALKPASPVELSSVPSISRLQPDRQDETGDARMGRERTSKQATSAAVDDEEERARKRENRRSISRPTPRNVSAHRRSGLMAREPRVLTESTQDFADFIRSTGPAKEQEVLPIIDPATRSTTSLHSLRSSQSNATSRSPSTASQERTRSITKSAMVAENIPPVPPVPSKTKSRTNLHPRSATGTGSNAELIDFIRAGPTEEGQQRIPREIAPFRNTMDSDQMRQTGDAINGITGDPNATMSGNTRPTSGSSTQRRPASQRTAQSSNNAAATVHPAHSGQPQRLSAIKPAAPEAAAPVGAISAMPGAMPQGMPPRRRHRNKDPYAIDLDDDDNDLLTALPMGKRQEETLSDFLKNAEPPETNAPRPLVNGNGVDMRSLTNKPRSNSVHSQKSAHSAAGARAKSMQSQQGPRPGAPSNAASASQTRLNSPLAGSAGSSKPRMEAREPGISGKTGGKRNSSMPPPKESSTKELADFLKNSGPEQSAPAPIVGRQSKLTPKEAAKAQKKVEKESKGAKRGFFGKSIRKTWLDMP
ncbi:hypothetical protein BAUCODRAFT_27660 [Baudoinia panamericana UAMH 10762]|uniref:Uncharacterized protein n=1 Tax=Baudoinia panamericana (strain UAMH 10762) TaxID=717646 RepID=M2N0A0_BAUPA|nr:uncharacterized protein BAUCODRAFT_27660 [Baudoinia panamericana UAMH 10762]EMC92364.1 hypothetical protein BAUCODRAFT_27660 [Baudoinia panamericana UAMH 10762]